MASGAGRALEKAHPMEKQEDSPMVNRPSEEQIRLRAHQIWLQRGEDPGSDLQDWLQAEEEIRREMANQATTI